MKVLGAPRIGMGASEMIAIATPKVGTRTPPMVAMRTALRAGTTIAAIQETAANEVQVIGAILAAHSMTNAKKRKDSNPVL